MRNEQIKTAQNNSYGQNWPESTDFRVVIMNSKGQAVEKGNTTNVNCTT